MKSVFDKIAGGIDDALSFANGEESRARVAAQIDVKGIRAKTKKSQADFAKTFNLSLGTLRDWEQNRRQPDSTARTLLSLIEADGGTIERLLSQATQSTPAS